MSEVRGRYWVFGGSKYYPDGGMADFKSSFDSVDEARGFAAGYVRGDEGALNWAQVWDSHDSKVIWGRGAA